MSVLRLFYVSDSNPFSFWRIHVGKQYVQDLLLQGYGGISDVVV